MKIKRKIENKLLDWLKSNNRKPVILRGARQVGKTFVVNQFAENFEHFIELNLERPRERELFNDFNTGQELLERIMLYKGLSIKEKNTLLFIDEIQNSFEAIRSLRYLYEDLKELRVIAAGSLLEVFSQKQGFSFPVGRVNNLFMFPVNFQEYIEFTNPLLAQKLFEMNFIDDYKLHDILLDHFFRFSFIGGMPEVLTGYKETGLYSELNDIYDSILLGYFEDIEKYSNLAKSKYLSHVIDKSPLYMSERITYEKFGESLFKSREMKDAFDILERALIIYRAKPSSSTKIPLKEKIRKAPKLFFLDTGLANYRIGFKDFFDRKKTLDNIYQGKVSEQIVAQEIVSQNYGFPKLYFWIREKGNSEIDFLYPYKDLLIPIEVKSGKTGKLRSLYQFMEIAHHPYAIRFYSGKSQVDQIKLPSKKNFYLFSLPYFFLPRLTEAIDWFVAKY